MGWCDHQGEESAGNCPPPTLGVGYRRLVPAPRFGSSSGGSLVRGWLRRHLPPDVGGCGPPVRTVRKLQNCLQAGGGKRRTCRRRQKPTHTKLLWSSTTGKTTVALILGTLSGKFGWSSAFFCSGWGLTSAGLCTHGCPPALHVAGMSRQPLQIRANILYVYADQYIAVSAHSEGWRVEPAASAHFHIAGRGQ